ncbi:mucin-16 [Falco rusticolus]|uniref:mucin-16 n=1 Tax=Falco rusticolus TaxID=120794 RepID=UPI00188669D8|nr:mucin-16 [Falco rusticolus]
METTSPVVTTATPKSTLGSTSTTTGKGTSTPESRNFQPNCCNNHCSHFQPSWNIRCYSHHHHHCSYGINSFCHHAPCRNILLCSWNKPNSYHHLSYYSQHGNGNNIPNGDHSYTQIYPGVNLHYYCTNVCTGNNLHAPLHQSRNFQPNCCNNHCSHFQPSWNIRCYSHHHRSYGINSLCHHAPCRNILLCSWNKPNSYHHLSYYSQHGNGNNIPNGDHSYTQIYPGVNLHYYWNILLCSWNKPNSYHHLSYYSQHGNGNNIPSGDHSYTQIYPGVNLHYNRNILLCSWNKPSSYHCLIYYSQHGNGNNIPSGDHSYTQIYPGVNLHYYWNILLCSWNKPNSYHHLSYYSQHGNGNNIPSGDHSYTHLYSGVSLHYYRPVREGDDTAVDAVCTYRKEPSALPLDRVRLYHEVSNKTRGITRLGPYSLDKDSLYVNGYNEQPVRTTPSHPPTTPAALEHFTVNFTITNLPDNSDLATPHSAKFNATRRVMNTLLDRLLKESSIGPAFRGCETTAFRPVREGDDTAVDAVCTYRKEPSALPLDRVRLYHEVSNKTRGITRLGPYSLDKDSLYVNGYNEQPVRTTPSHPPTTPAALEHFTVNFTITNLPDNSDLATPHSAKFNATRRVMNTLLDRLLKESSIGPAFRGCETTAFRPVREGDDTAVDAVCTYRKEPSALPLDRVRLYHEVSNKTRGITRLGPYSLDKDSLYVNGYNEQPVRTTPSHPPTTPAALEHFTVNFTITNLPDNSDLATPHSAKFNATRRVMNTLLDRLLKESSIGPAFRGCETTAFRPVREGDDTAVDAVCTYRKEPSALPLDRVRLYHEVSNKTRGITRLGPYSLDKDSLYVNGYNEQPVRTTPSHPPTTPAALEHFTVNFTITNLPDNSDLVTPHSAKFNATRRVMNTLVRAPLLQQSLCPR